MNSTCRPDLQEAVARYNEAAEAGVDPAFHKSDAWLKPLTGPFVALDCTPGAGAFLPHFTLGGLDTTVDGVVLNAEGAVINGLYGGRTACGVRRGDGYALAVPLAMRRFRAVARAGMPPQRRSQ